MFELIPWRRKGTEGVPARYRGVRDDFEDLVDKFFEPGRFFPESWSGRTFMPAVDISENDGELFVKAEIPGIDHKDLEINLSGDVLTIKGEKKEEKVEDGKNVHRLERTYGSFSRSFSLPCEVNAEKVEAKYKDGILSLRLPKAETCMRKSTRIPIQ